MTADVNSRIGFFKMNAIIHAISIITVDETISSSTFPFFEQYLNATFDGEGRLLPAFQQSCMDDCFTLIDEAFVIACKNGDLKTVNRLLRGPIDPSAGFVAACENGHVYIVTLLLRDKIRLVDKEYAFKVACKNGHCKVVNILLQDDKLDPTINDDEALRLALGNGRVGVMDILLRDGRVGCFLDRQKHCQKKL